MEPAGLHGLAQPGALLGHLDVAIVVAGCAGVDATQRLDGLQRIGRAPGYRTAHHLRRQGRQILRAQSVGGEIKVGIALRLGAQRVDVRAKVAAHADVVGDDGRGSVAVAKERFESVAGEHLSGSERKLASEEVRICVCYNNLTHLHRVLRLKLS